MVRHAERSSMSDMKRSKLMLLAFPFLVVGALVSVPALIASLVGVKKSSPLFSGASVAYADDTVEGQGQGEGQGEAEGEGEGEGEGCSGEGEGEGGGGEGGEGGGE